MKHRRFWIRFYWWMGMAFSFVGGALFVTSVLALIEHFDDRWLFQLVISVGFILIGFLALRFRRLWLEIPDIALDQQRNEMVRASQDWVAATRAIADHVMECPTCRTDPAMALGSYSAASPRCRTRKWLEQKAEDLRVRKQGLIDAFPWTR